MLLDSFLLSDAVGGTWFHCAVLVPFVILDGQISDDGSVTQPGCTRAQAQIRVPLKSSWERRFDAATESATDQLAKGRAKVGALSASQALSVTQLSGVLMIFNF
jgi:hypothetical protein